MSSVSAYVRGWMAAAVVAALMAAGQPARAEAPGAREQEPAGPSEDQVFSTWLNEGREVASLRSKVGAARFDVVTASLWPNPQLALSGGYLLSGEAVSGKLEYSPQLSVALPVFGQIAARKAEARANLRVAEVEVMQSVWEQSEDIQSAMLERAFADAEASEIQHNLDELSRIDRIVRERARAGANSSYDVLRVSTTDATFRAALAAAFTQRNRAESHLVSLVAAPSVQALPVTRAGLKAFRGPENESALVRLALQRRPDLELARRGIAAAHASAARLRREVVPIPSLTAGPAFTTAPRSVYIQAGIALPLPLFDRNQGTIGRALVEAAGQQALAEAVEQRVHVEVSGAWRAREEARLALTAFREGGLKATDELLRRAEVSYQAGAFQILDLLDAYRAVWDARAQELALERAFAESESELEHAAALLPLQELTSP